MKIRCKFKDPDAMHDAVVDAVAKLPTPDGMTAYEWATVRNNRSIWLSCEIADQWMEYGEYLDVEFDTDAKTATILPRGTIK